MNERGEIPETGGGPQRGSCIALTGATGFLGSHIADQLLARGYRVRASVRASSDLRWVRGKNIEIRETDLFQASEVREFVTGATAVIHCAGVVAARDEESYRRGNVDTTRVLLAAAADLHTSANSEQPDAGDGHPVAFVLISSLAAAGPASLQFPQSEDRPCQPITDYGRSKLRAERYVLDESWPFRTVVLRPPSLYGPRDAAFLPLFKAAQSGWTARFGRKLNGVSLVHGADAAAAALALLENDSARGAYFVDDGGLAATDQRSHNWGYDFDELRAALAETFGRRIRSLRIPLGALKFVSRLVGRRLASRSTVLNRDRLADLDSEGWVCCGEKLQRDTDFRPSYGLVTGFADTLAYYRRSGWLR